MQAKKLCNAEYHLSFHISFPEPIWSYTCHPPTCDSQRPAVRSPPVDLLPATAAPCAAARSPSPDSRTLLVSPPQFPAVTHDTSSQTHDTHNASSQTHDTHDTSSQTHDKLHTNTRHFKSNTQQTNTQRFKSNTRHTQRVKSNPRQTAH